MNARQGMVSAITTALTHTGATYATAEEDTLLTAMEGLVKVPQLIKKLNYFKE